MFWLFSKSVSVIALCIFSLTSPFDNFLGLISFQFISTAFYNIQENAEPLKFRNVEKFKESFA